MAIALETTTGAPVSIPNLPTTEKPKAKKPAAARKPKAASAHPPYLEMIGNAISSLKERTGSSQYAITKFIEEKHKGKLPPNFKKLLLVQLKKFVAGGKLIKLKASYKLSPTTKPKVAAPKKPKALKPKAASPKKPKVLKPKTAAPNKPRSLKPKTDAAKPKAKVTVAAKLKPKKAAASKKAVPAAKKPKTVKSASAKLPARK